MNQEMRYMIGSALHDEPPLRIDRARVLRTGRRRVRLRRAGLAGGATLGVVAAVLAAATVTDRQMPNDQVAAAPTSTKSSAPAPPGVACPEQRIESNEGVVVDEKPTTTDPKALAEAGRLTQAFERFAFPATPGMTVPKAVLCASFNGESWRTVIVLGAPTGERRVSIQVRARGAQAPDECATAGGALRCTTQALPNGTVLKIEQLVQEPSLPEIDTVTAWRPDGTVVRVEEWGLAGGDGQPAAPRVLDNDALIKVATAPELKTEWPGPVKAQPAAASDRRAAELTEMIAQANVVPPGMTAVDPLRFIAQDGSWYTLHVDLVDAAGRGDLFIALDRAQTVGESAEPTCDGLNQPHHRGQQISCELITLPGGRKATVVREGYEDMRGYALSLRSVQEDGTDLTIMSRPYGKERSGPLRERSGPLRAEPPLDADALIRIASLPGLRW